MMLALVLAGLIIVIACARSVEQSEAYGVVVRFVPTIFSIVEHGQTARAIGSREVGPLLRYHLVGCVGVIAAIHCTYAQVVSSFAIGKSHRKFHFKQRVGFLPVDFVIYIDAVGLSALVEADVLHYARASGAECALYAQCGAQFTIFHKCDASIGYRLWFLFHFASDDFPCRPLLRNIRSEECQTESLTFGHHLLAVSLIYERSYVAVIVESEAIDAVFDGISLIGKGFMLAIGWANVVDGISQCGHRSSYENLGAAGSIAHHLSLYATAGFVGNAHATDGSRGVESYLYHIGSIESGRIIEHQRSAAHLGVEIASYSAHRGGENACKLLEAQQFIVPRKFIGTRKTGAGEVVVKLVPNKSFPCLGK